MTIRRSQGVAIKSIDPISVEDIPPYADPSAYVQRDGKWYLTDDLLRGVVNYGD